MVLGGGLRALGRAPLRLLGLGRCVTWAGRADGSLVFWGICVGFLLLLWVHDAGSWGRDASLQRSNQVTTTTDPLLRRASQDLPLHALGTLGRV